MAERIIRQLVDDLDQSEITEGEGGSVEFAFRGTGYTIDLSMANAAKLEQALAPFIAAATRVTGPRVRSLRDVSSPSGTAARRPKSATPKNSNGEIRGKRRKSSPPKGSDGEIRAWASANGHEVGARGRVPASVVEAYEQARTLDGARRGRR